ncbi:unnamed protein product [Alopecurus aequalis]
MNRLRNSRPLFSHILRHYNHHPTSLRRPLMNLCSSIRGFVTIPQVRPIVRPSPAVPPLHRQYGTTSLRSFVLRWYHDPRKVGAVAAITLSTAAMAACSRYDREIVPCTYRSHLVVFSHQEERDLGEAAFAEAKKMYLEKNMIVDPRDPDSVRVHLILERIVHAAHRGLGIDDSNDAPMLRVTEKRRRWGKTSKPQTSHLRGLNWEVMIVRDDRLKIETTPAGKFKICIGLFDWFKTDEEIAAILAHEVGHIIARHPADFKSWWLPPFLRRIVSPRFEIEADYIGILLLGAAGFDPRWALVFIEKMAKIVGDSALRSIRSTHPNPKKRLRLLSEPKIMEEAMELYREVTAMDKVTDQYFQFHTPTAWTYAGGQMSGASA